MKIDNADESTTAPTTSSAEWKKDNRKHTTVPPDGYICKLCSTPGHWIQQCPDRTQQSQKKRKQHQDTTTTPHSYQPGIEPSPQDIARARALQALVPPSCECGIPSRLKKVKRSRVTEGSRANGKYFFFCSKRKDDRTKCSFAQLVVEDDNSQQQQTKAHAHFFANKRRRSKADATS